MFKPLSEAENERLMMKIAGIKVNPAAEKLKNHGTEGKLLESESLEKDELLNLSYNLAGIKNG